MGGRNTLLNILIIIFYLSTRPPRGCVERQNGVIIILRERGMAEGKESKVATGALFRRVKQPVDPSAWHAPGTTKGFSLFSTATHDPASCRQWL